MVKVKAGRRVSKKEMLKAYLETGNVEDMYDYLDVSHSRAQRRQFRQLVKDGYLEYDNSGCTYRPTEKAEEVIDQ